MLNTAEFYPAIEQDQVSMLNTAEFYPAIEQDQIF